MKRPLSLVLADAFDRAAHDVFVAPQVAAAEGDQEPSKWSLWVTWCRGFVAGFVGDGVSMPLIDRLINRMRKAAYSPALKPTLSQIATRPAQEPLR